MQTTLPWRDSFGRIGGKIARYTRMGNSDVTNWSLREGPTRVRSRAIFISPFTFICFNLKRIKRERGITILRERKRRFTFGDTSREGNVDSFLL